MSNKHSSGAVITSVARDDPPVRKLSKLSVKNEEENGQQTQQSETRTKARSRWGIFKKIMKFTTVFHRRQRALLPPQSPEHVGRKTLVLDLDETLVHASFEDESDPDFTVPVKIGRQVFHAYVKQRPYVQKFLDRMAELYEVVVFTASLKKYANPVIDTIDPNRAVKYRLFRESCVSYNGSYVKDLSLLGRDVSQIIIIDNAPVSYLFHPNNAIPCTSWFDNRSDSELDAFIPLLEALNGFDNVVAILEQVTTDPSVPETLRSLKALVDGHLQPSGDSREDDWIAEHMPEPESDEKESEQDMSADIPDGLVAKPHQSRDEDSGSDDSRDEGRRVGIPYDDEGGVE